MWLFIFKVSVMFFSVASALLMLVFSMAPKVYVQIEKFLALEFGGGDSYVTVLEGEVDFLNVWLIRYRLFFGPLLAVLSAINAVNAYMLY